IVFLVMKQVRFVLARNECIKDAPAQAVGGNGRIKTAVAYRHGALGGECLISPAGVGVLMIVDHKAERFRQKIGFLRAVIIDDAKYRLFSMDAIPRGGIGGLARAEVPEHPS